MSSQTPEDCGIKSTSRGEEGESIFEPASRVGLEASAAKDHWQYDPSKSSWTRFIVVARVEFFHPGEGVAEEKRDEGPKLSSLRDCRWTLPDGVRPIKDSWRREAGELEIGGDLVEWTGKVVFFERWAQDDSDQDSEEAELKSEMQGMELGSRGARVQSTEYRVSVNGVASIPGDLVFQDIPERNIADDLAGKPLEAVRATSAKHEELTEMYRRQVWVERSRWTSVSMIPANRLFRSDGW